MAIYSVSQINAYISELMSSDALLKRIIVRGEISNFKFHSSGHCYFTLKDETSAIKAVIFRRFAQKLRFRPENGMLVLACGNINVYERDGVYQLYVEQLVPEGAGALSLRYEQLKKQLAEEGLFAEENKKALPMRPKCVGILTSKTGAVVHDIFKVASNRDPSVRLLLFPVSVQGKDAAGQLVEALHYFNAHRNLCDVIIIGRGGGSMEDLWPFNEENVVRAVYASTIPVVSAVGHETDYTLTDFVSDVRAATPSHAAELCVPSREEWLRRLALLENHATDVVREDINTRREQLHKCMNSIVFKNTYYLFGAKYQQLDLFLTQLDNALQKKLDAKKNMLSILAGKISLLNPQAALQRGYSMVYKGKQVVKSTADLKRSDKLKIILTDGQVLVSVEDIAKDM